MTSTDVPVIDLKEWRTGDTETRVALAARVDHALRTSGFLLADNHGIDEALTTAVREQASRFFALPEAAKDPYRTRVGGRGWIPPGAESNSYSFGIESPPDLKETFKAGSGGGQDPTNLVVAEVPDLHPTINAFLDASWAVAVELFDLLAAALDLPKGTFTSQASRLDSSLNVNYYPPLRATGPPAIGQFCIGGHSDFGVLTLLDRQPGYGGLQIELADGRWIDAPWVPGTLTINIGDLLARWTGDRWRSTVHRVLPPSDQAPDEALISLVHFCGVGPDTLIETLPVGGPRHYEPVTSGDYTGAKLRSIDTA
jgi:isopenicillin N synthase-like dioxygenase